MSFTLALVVAGISGFIALSYEITRCVYQCMSD